METLETADEKGTIRNYVMGGLFITVLVTLALYTLWGRVEAQIDGIEKEAQGPHHVKSGGESASGAGGQPQASSSHRRLLIKHLLQEPAIDQAQRCLLCSHRLLLLAHMTRCRLLVSMLCSIS